MCERPSIDEVYLNLTDAAALMLLEAPPELLEEIDEEDIVVLNADTIRENHWVENFAIEV